MISNVMLQMIAYFGDDVRRINHALKVYGFAKAIAGEEGLEEARQVVELAGILHDIGIKEAERKYKSTAGPYQEQEGPPIAARMMDEARVSQTVAERVCFLVGNHHSYDKIDGPDFQILVEADFLVNIAEDGMTPEMIRSIGEKYFQTTTGRRILASLYKV